jgi:hypothetical protein
MRAARLSSVPTLALALAVATFVAFLPGCCCTRDMYVCRVCVAKPSCRYCVEGRTLSTESDAILDAKETLCEGLRDVAVPGINTATGADCVAEPEKKFTEKCRKETHVGGTALGGRIW